MDMDPHTEPIPQTNTIDLDKVGSLDLGADGIANPGDIITYTFTVTNTGTTTLDPVILTDPLPGLTIGDLSDSDGDGVEVLAPGAVETATGTYAITQADIDAGEVLNEATVKGTAPNGEMPMDMDPHTEPIPQNPELTLAKDGFYTDEDGNGLDPGDTLNYTFKVTNIGNVNVNDVSITEISFDLASLPAFTIVSPTDTDLSPGEMQTWTGTYTLDQADINAIFVDPVVDNVAQANGTTPNEVPVLSNEDPADIPFPPTLLKAEIDIEKSTNGEDADIPTGPSIFVGDPVTWEYVVTNTGNVSLTDIDVNDSELGLIGTIASLDPGESQSLTATGTAELGQYMNLGTATGLSPASEPVSDEDPSHYLGEFPFEAPGVRTPGFWGRSTGRTPWTNFWDGIQGNEPSQASQPNYPDGDLFHPPYTNSAVPGKVLDPVTDTYEFGVLVGDYNRNGKTDIGEDTLFYTTDEALQIINASNKVQRDKRYTLGRSMIASWLNYLAGNPIDTADPTDMDTRYYINEAIDWLQALTPDETDDDPLFKTGDGYLAGLGDETLDEDSPAIAASDDLWNFGAADAASLPDPYKVNTGAGYPLDAGNIIHGALDAYNNFGTGADGAFPG